MPLTYNGYELRPVPFATITDEVVRNPVDETVLVTQTTINLRGTIVPSGSAVASGSTSAMNDFILEKQAEIRGQFQSQGKLLSITPFDSQPNSYQAYCLVDSIAFQEGPWVQKCDYQIQLRSASGSSVNGSVRQATESWQLNEQPDATISINHSVQATAMPIFGSGGINNARQDAKAYCYSRLYRVSSAGVLTPPANYLTTAPLMSGIYGGVPLSGSSTQSGFWNYALVEGIGITDNSWQITEAFLYYPSGSAREEFTVSYNEDLQDQFKTTATVAGSIFGFAGRDSDIETKITNAVNHWNNTVKSALFGRVNTYMTSGLVTNPTPVSKQTSIERPVGVFRYNYIYRGALTLLNNAVEESIQVTNVGPTDRFAEIEVPGRAAGPVFQYMSTQTSPERAVSITAIIAVSGTSPSAVLASWYSGKPDTTSIIQSLAPSTGKYYVRQNSEDWNPLKGQYSRQVVWVMDYSSTASGVTGMPWLSNIHNP